MSDITITSVKTLILASTSPRRRALLQRLGIPFTVVPSHYEEELHPVLSPDELVKQLSSRKAHEVAVRYPNAVILGADTVVVSAGQVLGKPHTKQRAIEMLRQLSGQEHLVITGYTILDADQKVSRCVETKVRLRQLSRAEIEEYVGTGEPLDKAGAYGIQGLGGELVETIEGDYDNIVGLPLTEVALDLTKFGFMPKMP
jgi:septum formation protein